MDGSTVTLIVAKRRTEREEGSEEVLRKLL